MLTYEWRFNYVKQMEKKIVLCIARYIDIDAYSGTHQLSVVGIALHMDNIVWICFFPQDCTV